MVITYGIGNSVRPDARAVWIIPTNVMSWDAMESKRSFKCSMFPDVLCFSNMEYAMVPFFASSLVMGVLLWAFTLDSSSSGIS